LTARHYRLLHAPAAGRQGIFLRNSCHYPQQGFRIAVGLGGADPGYAE
jgi:hypothetical protein